MYPYFTIVNLKIYMTGLGIVIGFICFVLTIWYASKRHHVSFYKFFYWLPISIAIIYIFGAYAYFVIDDPGFLYPISRQQINMLLSPHGYRFHAIGIILGVIFSSWLFLLQIPSKIEKIIRIDVLFYGWAVSLIPTGLFFVLGENFIGLLVEAGHGWGVMSLHADMTTRLRKFSQPVLPIGLRLSVGSACIVFIIGLWSSWKRSLGIGMIGFMSLLCLLFVVLMYQQYPRHLPLGWGIDVKHYVIVGCVVGLYIGYRRTQEYLRNKPLNTMNGTETD